MTAATWLLGWATGLLLVGLAGLISALAGHVPDWADLFVYFPILLTGTAIGWLGGAALEMQIWRDKQRVTTRLDEARAWASELSNQEREARLTPVVAVATTETPHNTHQDWYWAVETFVIAGDVGGFSIRRMQGVVGSDVWAQLTGLLADAGWLAKAPGRGYVWADGYTLARAMQELRAERLPFPDGPAPEVREPVNSLTQRNATRQATTVIQGN